MAYLPDQRKERCKGMIISMIESMKKKIFAISILFFITGAIITFAGYSMTGFDLNRLDLHEETKWFQTIHMEDGHFWIGISLGDGRIMAGTEFWF